MKKLTLIAIGILFSGLLTAEAQTSKKQISDPTYSRHNYKHPNKAAEARENDDQAVSASVSGKMENVMNPTAARRNYKAQDRTQNRIDALLILPGKPAKNTLNPLTSPRNYKIQNQVAPKAKPAPKRYEPMVNTESDSLLLR